MHVKNEIFYVQLFTTIVLQQLSNGQAVEDKQKLVQFAIIFNLLNKGKSMIHYEDFQPLYEFLKFQSLHEKHQSNGASWKITKYIRTKVLKVTKVVIQNSKFISLICDEVITMDNASWANVHGYIVQDQC